MTKYTRLLEKMKKKSQNKLALKRRSAQERLDALEDDLRADFEYEEEFF